MVKKYTKLFSRSNKKLNSKRKKSIIRRKSYRLKKIRSKRKKRLSGGTAKFSTLEGNMVELIENLHTLYDDSNFTIDKEHFNIYIAVARTENTMIKSIKEIPMLIEKVQNLAISEGDVEENAKTWLTNIKEHFNKIKDAALDATQMKLTEDITEHDINRMVDASKTLKGNGKEQTEININDDAATGAQSWLGNLKNEINIFTKNSANLEVYGNLILASRSLLKQLGVR